jgi:hypothetical protein
LFQVPEDVSQRAPGPLFLALTDLLVRERRLGPCRLGGLEVAEEEAVLVVEFERLLQIVEFRRVSLESWPAP